GKFRKYVPERVAWKIGFLNPRDRGIAYAEHRRFLVSAELAHQLCDRPLFFRGQRRQCCGGDLGSSLYRGLRHLPAAGSEGNRPTAAIFLIIQGGYEIPRLKAVNHALDGCSIEIDQAAEMILGA